MLWFVRVGIIWRERRRGLVVRVVGRVGIIGVLVHSCFLEWVWIDMR